MHIYNPHHFPPLNWPKSKFIVGGAVGEEIIKLGDVLAVCWYDRINEEPAEYIVNDEMYKCYEYELHGKGSCESPSRDKWR